MKHVTLSCSHIALCSLGVFDRRCGRSAFYLLLQKQSCWVMGKNKERLPVMKVYTGSIHALLRWHALRKISSRHKWQGETVPRKDEPERFFDSAGKNGHTSGRIPLAKAYYVPNMILHHDLPPETLQTMTKPQQIKTRQRAIFRRNPLLQYTTLWVFRWCWSCWKSHLEVSRLVDRYTWILALLLSVKHSKLNSNQ